MNIKQGLICISTILLSNSTLAASKWSGDWFEIEIILLAQLHDKSTQAEAFPQYSPLPKYPEVLDLLTPYLNPDIASLKQLLPDCQSPQFEQSLLEQSAKLPSIHPMLSLQQIAELADDVSANDEQTSDIDGAVTDPASTENTLSAANERVQDDFFDRVQTAQEKQSTDENSAALNDSLAPNEQENTLTNEAPPISEQELALVEQAAEIFSVTPFNYQVLYRQTNDSFCRIDEQTFAQLNPDPTLFSYNGFVVDNVPLTIDNQETLDSDSPYLVSKGSLQLNDIVKQLRRSKDFKPLLHMAWRQAVFDEKRATPVKIFAGDNLQAHFNKALNRYHAQRLAEAEQEAELTKILSKNGSEPLTQIGFEPTKSERLAQAKQQGLNDIFATINTIDDVDSVIASIQQASNLSLSAPLLDEQTLQPQPPIQPWYLEGLLNVYLKGVYLNINADFNVLNMTLAEQESLKLRSDNALEPKAIRFQQKRRVISQEVHYFDHPYMGLIVQIRRHQRPEPLNDEIDETTQANY